MADPNTVKLLAKTNDADPISSISLVNLVNFLNTPKSLVGLNDTTISGPTDQNVLMYDGVDWENKTIENVVEGDGSRSIVIGDGAGAAGINAIALGTNATAIRDNATAIGDGATANQEAVSSTAIGSGATTTWINGIAIGNNARGHNTSIGIGPDSSTSVMNYATVIGRGATCNGFFSLAMGDGARANNGGTNETAIALGYNANSNGRASVSIGNSANASNFYSVVIGRDARTSFAESVILGADCYGDRGSVMIGSGAFSAGSNDNNICIGRMARASDPSPNAGGNIVIGDNANLSANTSGSVTIGQNSSNAGNNVAIGYSVFGGRSNNLIIGSSATCTFDADNTVAIGESADGGRGESVAIGKDTDAGGNAQNNIAIGTRADVGSGNNNSGNSIAIGVDSLCSSINSRQSVALGPDSRCNGNNCVAIGNGAIAGDDELAIRVGGSATSELVTDLTPIGSTGLAPTTNFLPITIGGVEYLMPLFQ